MKKRFSKFILSVVVLTCSVQHAVFAVTDAPNLMDIFNQALSNDPQWLAYKSTLLSQEENIPIAAALLLPTLSGTGLSQYNHNNDRVAIPDAIPAGLGKGIFQFTTNNYGINLSENIINFADWANFAAAKASVKASTAQYGANYQQLMVTVAQAYFNVLQARDNLGYTITQRQAINQLYQQNLERYHVGLGTITDVYNAKAQLDNTISTEIGAKNNLLNALEALRAITGQTYTRLAALKDHIPVLNPKPKNVEDWVKISVQQNLTILSNRYLADSAREVIRQQFSGNLPTVTGIANYNELHATFNGSNSVNEGDFAAGAQIAVPIYSGGGIVANTQQAQYNYQTALSNLQEAIQSTSAVTRQNYNNVLSSAAQIISDKQAIISNQSSLESMIAAFQVGTRNMTDVLQAQTLLYQTQIAYSNDLYEYVMSILELKQSAGTLSPQDIAAINRWLTKNAPLTEFSNPYAENIPALTLNAPPNSTFTQPTTAQQQQQMQQNIKKPAGINPTTQYTVDTPNPNDSDTSYSKCRTQRNANRPCRNWCFTLNQQQYTVW